MAMLGVYSPNGNKILINENKLRSCVKLVQVGMPINNKKLIEIGKLNKKIKMSKEDKLTKEVDMTRDDKLTKDVDMTKDGKTMKEVDMTKGCKLIATIKMTKDVILSIIQESDKPTRRVDMFGKLTSLANQRLWAIKLKLGVQQRVLKKYLNL
jgi:hypothetical protein